MTDYLKRVAANILPLSVSQQLPDAFKEWYVTDEVSEYPQLDADCELCEQDGLRWQFGIANPLTGKHLWVGSVCILKFEIPMFDENGRLLMPREMRTALKQMIQQRRAAKCLASLRKVAEFETGDNILTTAVWYFEQHGDLSPKLAWVVLWKLKAYHIDHEPRWFKVALRRMVHRHDLRVMPTERVHDLWPSLSPSQRKLARDLGHEAPATLTTKGKQFTLEQWRAAGWTDALLRAHGYMESAQ